MIESRIRTRFIYFLYRLFLAAAAPLFVLYFLARVRRDARYRQGWRERLGRLPFPKQRTAAKPIWLHAVSVGEVVSAAPLIRALRESYPQAPVFVSTATVAGRAIAEEKLRPLADGVFYAPWDFVFAVRRVLRHLRPALVVVMETEIWPNLYREARRFGAALAIVNGRISDRALPRYRKLRSTFGPVLEHASAILVQSEQDRARYLELGAPATRTVMAGNLKFDVQPDARPLPPEIDRLLTGGPVVIAASTMPPMDAGDLDEDDVVIAAFRELAGRHPDLLLMLVPRRPERFSLAAEKLAAAGVRFALRSHNETTLERPAVLLVDSMGELSRLFAVADVVFMGGTLARRGGHNILEPACFCKPIVIGPHMENFAAIAGEFRHAGAVEEIADASQLAGAIDRLLTTPRAGEIGRAAARLAASKRGVTGEIAARLLAIYHDALPGEPLPMAAVPVRALWNWVGARKRRRDMAAARSLPRKVVSIGNITMGGSGKTPLTAWLAERLRERGLQPAILTRGYGRQSKEDVVLKPGDLAPVERTGDEAQIYLRRGDAHVGIGADRYRTGIEIPTADIFLLDDGFQHWKLRRDVDIVLIDALDPFPAPRLREPLESLARASAFVITRAETDTRAIERVLREHNVSAPIFRSRVVARHGTVAPFRSAVAFCGLGNPATFWQTLDQTGIDVRERVAFADHHRYTLEEIRQLERRRDTLGAEALVTTEKDAANLPELTKAIFAFEITIEVDRAAELLALIEQAES